MNNLLLRRLVLAASLGLFSLQADAQLNANFTSSVTSGCAPLSQVQFTDLSTGSPSTWLWNFGNGNTSTLQNPTASYPTPGVFTVTLTVTAGPQSDTETKTGYITVFQNPVALFTFSPPNPCTGNLVTFTSTSIPGDAPVSSFTWDFGDGNVVTTATGSTSHSYATANAYPVSVIITDTNGCTDNFDTMLVVTPQPVASFTYAPSFACNPPLTVTFTNTSVVSGSVSYLWYFGDGSTSTQLSPQHAYAANGNYTVKLVITQNSACKDSMTIAAPINVGGPVITMNQSATSICAGGAVQFSFTSVPAAVSYQWNFGDGTTSSISPVNHIYSAPGTYTVSLTAFDGNGCSESQSGTVTVHPVPNVVFGPQSAVSCHVPFTVQFQDSTAGAVNWTWSFGDGGTSTVQNPSHQFLLAGNYSISLTVANAFGCIDSAFSVVSLVPPVAGWTIIPQEGCVPLTVNFTSVSSAIEPITQFTWNFGAGQGSSVTTVPAETHTYSQAGVYGVSLVIETSTGCLDTITDSVRTGNHVIPNFTINDDSVCYGHPIVFTLNSPGANGWYWHFGDGQIDSVNQDPSHIYGNPGLYTVMLVACQNGCCDTLIIPDLITILPPRASFTTAAHDCNNPYTVTFNNVSVDADSSVWNFGDSTILSSNAPSVTHIFPDRGVYTIWLYTWNFTSGCSDSISISYTITDPVAAFSGTPLSGCHPLTVLFSDSSIDANSYTWFFGDGSSVPFGPSSISHTYFLPGYYDITLVIRDIYSCPDTLIKPQYVHVYGPLANFNGIPVAGCRPLTVTFNDSTVSEYPVVQYIWNFGDGTVDTVTVTTVTHTYTVNGIYNVSLRATDSTGCTHLRTKTQYIDVTYPAPKMTVDTFACRNEVLTFNGTATAVATPAVFTWDFGDGTLDTTATSSTTHAYVTEGTFVWQFTVTDRNGCDSAISGTILVEHPKAGFTFTENPGCGFNQIVLTDTSSGTLVTGAMWTATNGFISSNWPTANANFVNPGSYSITLISFNAAGCTDTVTQSNIIVVPGPIGTMTFQPDSGCIPLEVTFTLSSPNTLYYILDYGDGGLDSLPNTTVTVQHTYLNDTTVTPILYMATLLPNGSKCEIPYSFGSVTATSLVDAFITADGDTVIEVQATEGEEIQLSVLSSISGSGITYNWYPAAGLSNPSVQNPLLTVTAGGYYYVEVEDASGCLAIDSIFVRLVDCNEAIQVYNVITPNADGLNDEFVIRNPCFDNFSIIIYNRWGQKIFESDHPKNRFRGYTTDGTEVPDGTYYWIVFSGEKKLTGFVQLIRN